MLKAAFIFIAPEADPPTHRSVVNTPAVQLTVVGVPSYQKAELVRLNCAAVLALKVRPP